ncbi:MAG: TetR/AcrR family transcriptional regulator [Syntrophales bacterium]|jgi:AcrR family transcriptional regulator
MEDSNKRENILQAALELVAEHGFHGTPMSMIAEKAGVGAGTIYCYFKSKDELIIEVNHVLENKISLAIKEEYPFNKDIRKSFFHLCKTLFAYFITHPIHFRFLEQYFGSPYGMSAHRERIMGNTRKTNIFDIMVEQGIKQKVIKDLPLFIHFALTFGPVVMLVQNHVRGLIELDDAQIIRSIEASWDAIKM